MIWKAVSFALAGTLAAGLAHAQDQDLRAFMLASSCAACHGPAGDSPGAIPSLAGKSRNAILTMMQEFKTDASQGTVMNRHAKGYSDEELELIADYYARMGGGS